MARVNKLLVDADAFVAINYDADNNHTKAARLSKKIVNQNISLITSDPAFGEAITVISQKAGLGKAVDFAEQILTSQIEIIEVDAALRRSALEILKSQKSKNSRFTDCINMAILNERDLNTIFSFDKQYKVNKFHRFGIDKATDLKK